MFDSLPVDTAGLASFSKLDGAAAALRFPDRARRRMGVRSLLEALPEHLYLKPNEETHDPKYHRQKP